MCFHVTVHFVVEAAFQFGALAGKLLRIQGYVLETRRAGRYRYEGGHPGGAAEFASARTDATDASCFLAGAYLFHLDAYVEGVGKNLDELAEVHTLVGDVIEDGLVAVALIFHVAHLHVEVEV